MSDFESLIRTMIKNGASVEDIAAKAGAILNTVKQEKEKEKEQSGREETLTRFKNKFDESYKKNKVSIEDVANLCAFVSAQSFPEWGKKELEEFAALMERNIRIASSVIGKNTNQTLSILLDNFPKAFSDDLKELKTSYANKRKKEVDSCKKAAEPTSESKVCTCSSTPDPLEELLLFLEAF